MATTTHRSETTLLRQRVQQLEHEVEALQAELARQEARGSGTPVPRPPTPPLHRGLQIRPETLLLGTGGLLLLLGVAFLIALSIANGWLTPALQVALAEAVGAAVMAVGFALLERERLRLRLRLTQPQAGAVVGVGAGVVMLGLAASALAYDSPVLPLGVALASAAAAATLVCVAAVRADAQWLAAFGLGAALLAPLALGTGTSLAALAFIGTGLLATTILAATRSWPWLGPVAIATTAPQLIAYVQDRLGPTVEPDVQPRTGALLGLVLVWWLLVAYASIGCAMIRPLQRTSLPLSLGFALPAAGFAAVMILGFRAAGDGIAVGDITVPALLILAAAHALLVSVFALQADRASANGAFLAAALLTAIALPIDADPPLLSIFWAVLAVVVTAAGRRQSEPALLGGGLLLAGITWVVTILPDGPQQLLFGAVGPIDLSLGCAACLGMLVALGRILRADARVRLVWIAAAATTGYWLSVLFVTALTPETIRAAQGPDPDQTAQAALSIVWALGGLALVAVAVRDRSAGLRYVGIALLAATAIKVILLDAATLDAGLRVAAFIMSGLVLLVGAWLLSRLAEPEEHAPEEDAQAARNERTSSSEAVNGTSGRLARSSLP